MNLQELHALLAAERRSESLQSLPARFEEEVGGYLARLEGGKEGGEFVKDELRAARHLVEGLVDERLLKMAKGAVLRARGMEEDPPGLAPREAALFARLGELLREERRRLLTMSPGSPEVPPPAPVPEAKPGGVLLRVLQDVAPFTGADGRVYRLRKEEVAHIPWANAEPLLKRGVAEKIEAK